MKSRSIVIFVVAAGCLAGHALGSDSFGLAKQVEQAALETALAQIAAPDRLEVQSVRFGGADPIGDADVRLEPLDLARPNASGILRLRFRIFAGDRPLGEAFATVRGSVMGPVLVPRRTLSGRQPIEPADVERVDADLTRLGGEPLREVEQLVGLVPVRSLGVGRPISADLLSPAPLVRRGERVELEVRRGTLVVKAKGLARKDGARGDTVPVENLATGAELLGLVQGRGSLLVVRGPMEERKR